MVARKETILIVTANESLGQSLEEILTDAGYRPLTVSNESAALGELRQSQPSLVIMDRRQGNGSQLRQNSALRTVPVIALRSPTGDCAEEECVLDLEEGFDDSVCNQSSRQLIARIRAILRRQQYQSASATMYTVGDLQMNLDKHEITVEGKPIELTPKEFQILKHFLESPNRVFTRQEMLNCVWGEGYALEEHALDVHIHSLRHKMEPDPAHPSYIVTVRGVGYKLRTG
jgi:DNA-binding response OmpR family regulator